ncbi:MAG: hypothetical protein ACRCS8_04045 [Brevinema sp.]
MNKFLLLLLASPMVLFAQTAEAPQYKMTLGGWFFLIVSWTLILTANIVFFSRILKKD